MGFFSRFFGKQHKPSGAREGSVTFDDEKIVRPLADGGLEVIRWEQVDTVSVVTTDDGPSAPDVYFLIQGDGTGCLVPNEADGAKELLVRLQELPDFDNEAFVLAMGSIGNAEFLCWQRNGVA